MRKNDFREADAQLDMQKHNFHQASLQYVAQIQSVQERMKFEFVETLSSFIYKWLSFYHIGKGKILGTKSMKKFQQIRSPILT